MLDSIRLIHRADAAVYSAVPQGAWLVARARTIVASPPFSTPLRMRAPTVLQSSEQVELALELAELEDKLRPLGGKQCTNPENLVSWSKAARKRNLVEKALEKATKAAETSSSTVNIGITSTWLPRVTLGLLILYLVLFWKGPVLNVPPTLLSPLRWFFARSDGSVGALWWTMICCVVARKAVPAVFKSMGVLPNEEKSWLQTGMDWAKKFTG